MLIVILRLALATLFGGMIGLERGAAKHPAGFRTHILVCVGAALAMLTNEFVFNTITTIADPTRMGAQVITGVGFLGVGTILVTGGQQIRGLTTAAGLWASACIGLAIGIGFYSGAIVASLLVFASLSFLKKVENYVYEMSRIMDLYVELESLSELKDYQAFVQKQNITILKSYLNKSGTNEADTIGFHMSVKIPRKMKHADAIELLSNHEGIYLIEEM